MTNLEQKLDLVMRYIIADSYDESERLRDKIRNVLSGTDPETPIDIPYPKLDDLLDNTIEDLLRDLGAPCNLVGYERAKYAIKLVISDDDYLRNISKRLYPDVAKKFNTTPSRTERAIRHLIETAWLRHDVNDAYRVFGNTIDINRGRPMNSEFIAACAVAVKRRMRDAM